MDVDISQLELHTTTIIEVERVTPSDITEVVVGIPGPAGQKGERGLPGASGSHFTFVQSTPDTEWIVDHSLETFPSVTVVNSSGETVEGDVTYESNSRVVVRFSAAFSGTIYLN